LGPTVPKKNLSSKGGEEKNIRAQDMRRKLREGGVHKTRKKESEGRGKRGLYSEL